MILRRGFLPWLRVAGRCDLLKCGRTRPSHTVLFASLRLPQNAFSTSRPGWFSVQPRHVQTINDPSRADLFYHLIQPPNGGQPLYATSFVEKYNESSVIGWLPAEVTNGQGGEAGLNDFVENPKFRKLLHEAIQSGLAEGVDDIQMNGAIQLQNGWMHIHDERNIPPLGRIGDPEDIIASVLVEDGKILPQTYQPMPAYRICTSHGLTTLTPGLADKLRSSMRSGL